jgi:hypothetical protein
MLNDKLVILTYKNTIYQSKLKLLAIFVTILVCKQHTLFQTCARVQFIIQRRTQAVVNPTTIRSGPRRPLKWIDIFTFSLYHSTHLKWQCLRNSSKTDKNSEEWFSWNISGEMCSQIICVWAILIQVNQDNSASVWWTAHVHTFETANVVCKLKLLHKWLINWVLIDKLCSYR